MLYFSILTAVLYAATGLTITEPVNGGVYNGDWLTVRAIVENENAVPDSLHYNLNGGLPVQIPRLDTDWLTYMQNYLNHGFSESPAPTDNSILWAAPVTGCYHEFPTPVVYQGMVFYNSDSIGTGSAESLYVLSAATGELLWKYPTGYADDAVTVADGRVYCPAESLFCFNAFTGEKIWASSEANHSGSSPVVAGGRVYGGRGDKTLVCLNAADGSLIWSSELSGENNSCMAFWNDIIFVPSWFYNKSILFAVNANSGEVIWENTNNDGWGYHDSSPVVVDGVVYILDMNGTVMAIDALSGETVWQQQYATDATATMAYNQQRLYFATMVGPYYSIDALTGAIIWSTPGAQHGSSAVADGMVFYGECFSTTPQDSASVVALSCETGAEVWRFTTSCSSYGGFQGSPSVTDGVVYFPATDGYLYAFGTGLKYTYRDDLYADIGINELIVNSFDNGVEVAADTVYFTVTGTGISPQTTRHFHLAAVPNPVFSHTSISFETMAAGITSVEIFDLSGRLVATLFNGQMNSGTHMIEWNTGTGTASGLYLCNVRCGGVSETVLLSLLR
jgi:outer membrane protein assembly factor BamB